MSDVDQAYADLHERFVYLQQQTNRLGSAYVLATQELKSLKEDNQILKDKLIEFRLRRRKLAAQAENNMIANMNAKTLFCQQNRRVLRKQFPLISRDQLTAFVEEEWESLAPEVAEVREQFANSIEGLILRRNGIASLKPLFRNLRNNPKLPKKSVQHRQRM
ncbi:unnamed protein product [Aphanomyces euteiches]